VIASVKYLVPVWATVDVDAGQVISLSLQDDAMGEPLAYQDENGLALLPAEQSAVDAILTGNGPWPSWEIGL
jgi:hypothetical protein